jgi:alpha-ribazole phosphatase
MSYPVPQLRLRLLLIRHGQTDGNSNGRFVGHQDIPLNETGERQVLAAAQRLKKERPAAIYSSDLLRARQTASAIQKSIQFSISSAPIPELITDQRMREMHFGDWEGLTYSEIDKCYPEELKNWQADIYHVAPPGGESLQQLAARAHDFLEELLDTYSEQTVIVAGHGGTFEALAIKILKVERSRSWQFQLNNTGICEFKFFQSGPILSLWNDTCHLEQV